jgi:hypothetical protein
MHEGRLVEVTLVAKAVREKQPEPYHNFPLDGP